MQEQFDSEVDRIRFRELFEQIRRHEEDIESICEMLVTLETRLNVISHYFMKKYKEANENGR